MAALYYFDENGLYLDSPDGAVGSTTEVPMTPVPAGKMPRWNQSAWELVNKANYFGGMIIALSNVNGGTFNPFPQQECRLLTIINDTGFDLHVKQSGNTDNDYITIFDKTYFPMAGIRDASDILIRRKDLNNSAVTVRARWER